jgi:hypothetical protein
MWRNKGGKMKLIAGVALIAALASEGARAEPGGGVGARAVWGGFWENAWNRFASLVWGQGGPEGEPAGTARSSGRRQTADDSDPPRGNPSAADDRLVDAAEPTGAQKAGAWGAAQFPARRAGPWTKEGGAVDPWGIAAPSQPPPAEDGRHDE